ncbi:MULTISPECIES: type I-C CRISPR-associated endonuclease Cas1c [unclassified Methanoregula]|uniref:type I-C CRISPR-associated endonuclease Cas1c n=1 Tax=unclassified Methanoregula TaxID=2649730 RepID=UPI0009CBDAD7|nr:MULTISPECIES: type I-C CRISPR-associated endonuclease Cas1c [unclassified Methanoregula]OPX62902.1 MAG: CRISPR-associated endonuclease Cas1 [Methanoregula sp. PtaB.Bin085]OPY35339.1 MAG: CRISPR-associated endonuclease Cas1 [Methanoregula sp. PtaU1.Bin006]
MRKLLNTLYVTTPDSYLHRDGENVIVKVGSEEKFRIPIHNLEGIVCFGYMGASPHLMQLCSENNVGLSFLTPHGRFQGRVNGRVRGNVLLRRTQYRIADNPEASLAIARCFITAKIVNCRTVLGRSIRDHGDVIRCEKIRCADNLLIENLMKINTCRDADTLRGIEGNCAKFYFDVLDELILKQKDDFFIRDRNRRPPRDNMNALFSFLYTLLAHDVESALETVGLDPYVGFFHTDRPGRASLALDMMEELRPFISDRLALNLVNLQQVCSDDFLKKEGGGILLTEKGRKAVLAAWQKRKADEITHPYLDEKIPIGLLPYVQSLLMARFLRGDIEGYPPFFMN